jgi:hypothetical protein
MTKASRSQRSISKYFLYSHLQKTFHSLRKEARESFYISFHRAYILSLILIVILGILYIWTLNASSNSGYQMTRVESLRREKQEEKHFIRAQIAKQESRTELEKYNDRTVIIRPENITYVVFEK